MRLGSLSKRSEGVVLRAGHGEGARALVTLVLVLGPAMPVVALEGVTGAPGADVAPAAQSVSAAAPLVEQTAASLVGSLNHKQYLVKNVLE